MSIVLYIALLISAVHSYTPGPRWGQATSTIASSLFVYGGKQDQFNQFGYTSAPAQPDLLFLPLTSSFPADSPPWALISNQSATTPGPFVAWHTLSAYNASMLLIFGGYPSPFVPLATQPDSAWVLNVNNFDSPTPQFIQETSGWGNEPIRRIRHAAVSAPSGEVYIFGGEKSDDATPLSDNYVFNPATSTFTLLPTENAPPALTGHGAVILPNGQILVFGGFSSNGLLPLNTFWIFDTSTNSWSPNITSSTPTPSGRRAFAYTLLGDDIILIQGGASGDFQQPFSDGWVYNVTSSAWINVPNLEQLGARRDHFAVAYAQQVLFGFGWLQNGPANASLEIFNPLTQQFQPNFVPLPATATLSPTIPGIPSPTDNPSTPSLTVSVSISVHPTTTSDGGNNGGGDGTQNPSHTSKKTTVIAIGAILGVLAFVTAALGAVWYMRRQRVKRWREGGVGGVFSPLSGEEGGNGGPPLATRTSDTSHSEKSLVGSAVQTVGATLSSWGLWLVGALGLGALFGTGVAATNRDRKRRDMLADEDTRIFNNNSYGWYDGDGHSSRFRRQGSEGSWSMMSVFRPKARRQGSATSGLSFGSRMLSRGGSLLGHTEEASEKDPFSDYMQEAAAAGAAGAIAGSSRPVMSRRQSSYSSTASHYRDPFVDPILEHDVGGPAGVRLVQRGVLSPVTELSRISSSGASASHSGSSNDHQTFSPFDTLSRSSTSHQASASFTTPALSPAPSSISGRPRHTSILDMRPTPPDQPIRRSDTWWARFANKSLLDRRSSHKAAAAAPPDIRDPNPLPQRLGFVAEETASVLRERSDGSEGSAPGPYGRKGHGKSMSSLQTQQTADSAAIERMGNIDVIVRGNRQSGSTSTRGSEATHGESMDDGHARRNWQPSEHAEDNELTSSPVEMVPASSFGLPSPTPPREPTPPPPPTAPASRPPLSTASSSASSGSSGSVAERVRAYERRMSQDISAPPPTESSRTRRKSHGVNYGIVSRPSLFVANPDSHAAQGSGDS